MRYSVKHNYVYIGVPKTGTWSFGEVLRQHSEITECDGTEHHYTAEEYKRDFLGRGIPSFDYFYSFVSIRNPWARCVSLFNFGRPDEKFRMFWDEGYFPVNPANFNTWVSICWHMSPNLQAYADIDGMPAVNEVILLENYYEAIPNLLSRLGIPKTEISHQNASHGKPKTYQDWYNNETKEIISTRCEKEIEIGGYTFDGGFRKYSGAIKYA